MPSSGTHEENGDLVGEGIGLFLGLMVQCPGVGVDEVGLALEKIEPGGRGGVFEVGHEHPRPGVEGVDHHPGVDRPGDLDTAILKVGRDRCDHPVQLPDGSCRVEEVGTEPTVESLLDTGAGIEDLSPPPPERPFQVVEEDDGLGSQQGLLQPFLRGFGHKNGVSFFVGYNSRQVIV